MLALIVDLDVHAEYLNRFLAAIEENSLRTFEDEPGCSLFSVSRSEKDPLHFTFYEIYDDKEAFAQHRNTPHFVQWRAAADVCVVKGSQANQMTELLFLRGGR